MANFACRIHEGVLHASSLSKICSLARKFFAGPGQDILRGWTCARFLCAEFMADSRQMPKTTRDSTTNESPGMLLETRLHVKQAPKLTHPNIFARLTVLCPQRKKRLCSHANPRAGLGRAEERVHKNLGGFIIFFTASTKERPWLMCLNSPCPHSVTQARSRLLSGRAGYHPKIASVVSNSLLWVLLDRTRRNGFGLFLFWFPFQATRKGYPQTRLGLSRRGVPRCLVLAGFPVFPICLKTSPLGSTYMNKVSLMFGWRDVLAGWTNSKTRRVIVLGGGTLKGVPLGRPDFAQDAAPCRGPSTGQPRAASLARRDVRAIGLCWDRLRLQKLRRS